MNDATVRVDSKRVYHAEQDMIGKTFQVHFSGNEIPSESGVDMKTMQEIKEKSKGRYGYRFAKRSLDIILSFLGSDCFKPVSVDFILDYLFG